MPVELLLDIRKDVDDLFILNIIVMEHFRLKLITFNDDVGVVLMRRSFQLNFLQEVNDDFFIC